MGNSISLKHHVETAEKTGVIKLSKTNLRDIPKDLALISNKLRTLDLSFNRLQKLNDNIGVFTNLKILNLEHNKLKTLTPFLGDLVKLESLLLQNNLLDSLPDELTKLPSLKTLNLSGNNFANLPRPICHLASLEMLDVSYNQIINLPDDIGMCKATEINLNNNQVKLLNNSLVKCPNLKILRLDNNQLEITSITEPILADSKICLLSTENNFFSLKQLQACRGYEKYSDRFTSTKRKMF